MAETTITVQPNGPYLVKGSFELVDVDGKHFPVEREVIAMCRCGHSEHKPFCDGTHAKVHFDADTRAG